MIRCGKCGARGHNRRRCAGGAARAEPELPEIQRWCHSTVRDALKLGFFTRQPCEVCGDAEAQAHHDDYLKPLEVRWLCVPHHRAWHGAHGPGANHDAPKPARPRYADGPIAAARAAIRAGRRPDGDGVEPGRDPGLGGGICT